MTTVLDRPVVTQSSAVELDGVGKAFGRGPDAVTDPEHEEFRAALAKLPPDQREALILVGASGFSYEEAAAICECAVGTIVYSTIFAYDVQPDGGVKNKRTFAQLRDIPEGKESGADGMALDRVDRLYVTTVTGVQVFDATGQYLGTIKVPRQPANAGFAGPDKRTLYITAREGLYRLTMQAQGADRIGK